MYDYVKIISIHLNPFLAKITKSDVRLPTIIFKLKLIFLRKQCSIHTQFQIQLNS